MTDATDLATPPKGPSGKRLGFVVAAVALVALLALLAIGMTRDPRELPSALIGKPLPAFSLPGMKRADPPLTQADLLGKTRVINVWASWCVACQSEHPVLLAWQRELVAQGRGHTLYGVNYKDTPDAARIWLLRGGDPYVDSIVDAKRRLGIDLGVYGVPETFVVNAGGHIVFRHAGPLTAELIRTQIQPLLETGS